MTHDLAVIIPHYQDFVRLDRCLQGLADAEQLKWTDVVVVHSGPTQHDFQVEKNFPWARFIRQPEPGAGPARNAGVEATSAPFLLFIDCDCVPDKNILTAARAALDRSDVVGGRISLFDETPGPRTGAQSFEVVFAFRQKQYVSRQQFAVTANLATTRAVFDAVGPFAKDLSEDREWCHRVVSRGFSIGYDKAMHVSHPTRGSWLSLSQKWRRLIREDYAGLPSGPVASLTWLGRTALMPVSILRDLPKIWFSPRLNGPSERIGASWTLARLRLWRAYQMILTFFSNVSSAHTHLHSE